MSRLEKKCFIGATGFHLLLLVILLVGPAFFVADKVDDSPVIEFVPMMTTDEKRSNPGESAPKPPVAQPPSQPQVQPSVAQPPPQQVVEPVRQPDPPKIEPKIQKTDPDAVESKLEKKTPQVQISKKVVKLPRDTKTPAKPVNDSTPTTPQPNIYANAANSLRKKFTPTTKIEMTENSGGGGNGPSYANYAQEVRRVYTEAVRIPPEVNDDQAVVKVRVTIARNGNVISSSIIQSSGSPQMDSAIRTTLDRVTFVAPFPEGAKDSQRTFIINFDLKATKLLG